MRSATLAAAAGRADFLPFDVNLDEPALATRYRGLAGFSRVELQLLYQMLKSAGASELHDPLFWYLLRFMARGERRTACRRTSAKRKERED